MSGYLLGIIGIVLFSALITMVLPQGKTAEFIKSITRVACTVAILTPILQFFIDDNLSDFFTKTVIETDASFIQYSNEIHVKSAEKMLENALEERFETDVAIMLEWNVEIIENGQYTAEKVRIDKMIIYANSDERTR